MFDDFVLVIRFGYVTPEITNRFWGGGRRRKGGGGKRIGRVGCHGAKFDCPLNLERLVYEFMLT